MGELTHIKGQLSSSTESTIGSSVVAIIALSTFTL
jgi:hypothetical protein